MRGQSNPALYLKVHSLGGGGEAKALPQEASLTRVSSKHFLSIRDPWGVAEQELDD